ncbi:MAG: carboxypeptidase-like regulatory domain-containing protein, partial [Bacteroidales bacterium]|nr:carboxypeptidase-like regulatory domain-containing protein [Bacteroidales bacterium]
MKARLLSMLAALLLCITASAQDWITVWGRVYNAEENEPVYLSSVTLSGTNISTITNSEGIFSLKIPANTDLSTTIEISHLGFLTVKVAINQLTSSSANRPVHIKLTKTTLKIDPAQIVSLDPKEIFNEAFYRVKQNYANENEIMTAFYRETIRKNNIKYLSMCEAIIDISKAPYDNYHIDKAGIYKGRGNSNYSKSDTLMVNYQGGVLGFMDIDIVKNPFVGVLMSDVHKAYDLMLHPTEIIDGKSFYVIEFDQKPDIDFALYHGKIYIETETFAIARVEFSINCEKFPEAVYNYFIKCPVSIIPTLRDASYIVNYKESNGKWYYDYGRIEINFAARKRHSLFKANYNIVSEIAVTDHRPGAIEIDNDSRLRYKDIMASKLD